MVLLFVITPVFASSSFNTSLKYGSRGADVREMQEFLIDQGYLSGSVTGNFYALTLKAVKAFQAKNNLPASGFWGPASRKVAQTQVDLALSDEEDRITPVTSAPTTTATPVMPAQIQYIYVPTPFQAAPVVDTTAQQRQEIENEYNLKSAKLNQKVVELQEMLPNIRDLAIFWNGEYSLKDPKPVLPSFVRTQNQTDMILNIFDSMLSLNRWSINTPEEINTRIAGYLNTIYTQQSQLDIEKKEKLQTVK